jgi:hypothetical protein
MRNGAEDRKRVVYLMPPEWIVAEADLRRWNLSAGIASQIFEEQGEEAIWSAALVIFHSDIPT